jgi:hypothetical protein
MTEITYANVQFSESQVFRYEEYDSHFYIEAVVKSQPHALVFCLFYDLEQKKKLVDCDPKRFSASELSKAMWNGKIEFIDPSAAFSEPVSPTTKQQRIIDMWAEFINILKKDNHETLPRSDRLVKVAINKMNWAKYDYKIPCVSNCQDKIKLYDEAKGNAQKAFCSFGYHAMAGASRLAPATEDLLLCYVDDKYLVDLPAHRVNPAEIYREFCEEFELLNKKDPKSYPKLPCQESFYKRIRALDKVIVALHRLNDKEKQKLRKIRKTEFIVDRILQRVEFDAVHLAMGIIKYEGTGTNRKRVYRGRVVLMLAIDVFSRAIIGYSYHIAKKPGENADLAVQCFKSMLMPKNSKRNWPMYGKSALVVSDGSTAATGDQFHMVVTSTGAVHVTTQSNQPWKKPFIERFMLTLRKHWASKFDTYLGSKLFRNHDHLNNDDKVEKVVMKGKKKHCMTEEEFVDNFERYITDTYHNAPHGGLNGATPLEVWQESIANKKAHWTTMPNNHPVFTRMGLSAGMRNIHQDGCIRVNNALYACQKLKDIVGVVDKVNVYYSDIDADSIAFNYGGEWHRAELCPANYTPTDTTQRAELDSARGAQHGSNKGKQRRKSFQPVVSAPPSHSVQGDDEDKSKKTRPPLDMESENAEQNLSAAEDAALQNAPIKVQQALQNSKNNGLQHDEETVKAEPQHPRRRKIGEKL